MMHYSSSVYESQQVRRSKSSTKDKQHIKTNGSYFQVPLVEKTLSTKPLSFRNVFRSVVEQYATNEKSSSNHFLDLTPMQSTTLKTMNLQKLWTNVDVKKAFRRHYRIDIKEYLKRKYGKFAYEIPLEAFELMRYVDERQIKEPWRTSYVYIYKPFYMNENLKRRIECDQEWNKEIFKAPSLVKLFRQLLKCSLQFGGLDNFIMTTSNVYMEEDLETLQINYTSFTGLGLLKCGVKIGAHEYFQVLPYFTQNMINNNTIGYQERIRFFLINCLCLLTKKDFVLEAEQIVEADHTFSLENVKTKLKDRKKIADQFQAQINLIRGKQKKNMMKRLKLDSLMTRGLVQGQELTWHQIVSCIWNDEKAEKEGQSESNVEYGKKIQQAFRALHVELFANETNKEFYTERNIESQLLYIPIKYKADLPLIFEKKAWWEVFNCLDKQGNKVEAPYNIFHTSFCFRLLDAVIDQYAKSERNQEWALKFRDDPVIQILFQYINSCEYPCIISHKSENPAEQKATFFQTFYEKYMSIKEQAQKNKKQ